MFHVAMINLIGYLDTLPGYSCPAYCEVDHVHFKKKPFGLANQIPTDESVF